ncbi:tyrosine-type recombinase/integrase [Pseudomonas sp. AL-54]|nr:tyrosine-type recombinase/integrase [Pseudomonas lopnurensis]
MACRTEVACATAHLASHFIANGGNILTLQKILGHSSLAMTMRYAHLSPDHLQDVLAFGPAKDFRHSRLGAAFETGKSFVNQ